MTGGGAGLVVSSSARASSRARWVGRASLLDQWPGAPQWLRYCVLTSGLFGVSLVWSCEMSQASPYLLSLGLSKSLMSLVFVAGPLSGLIVQPVVGVLSDGCRSSLGRRKPYVIAGCVASALAVLLLGWAPETAALITTPGGSAHQHFTILLAVLSVYIIDFSINVVQAMDRSLLVDVVPAHLQPAANAWASRLSGFGSVLGYWVGGIDLVSLTGGWFGQNQLKVLTIFTSVSLCICHLILVVGVKERVLISREDDGEGEEGGETMKALKGIWGTFRTLPKPIHQVLNVQFASWVGWFPVLFFSTTWVAESYSFSLTGSKDLASASPAVLDSATRAGTRALFLHSVVALLTSILLPPFIAPFPPPDNPTSLPPLFRRPSDLGQTPFSFIEERSWLGWVVQRLPTLPIPWLSLSLIWTVSNGMFSLLLFSTYFATSVAGSSAVVVLMGFCWAVTNWAPFSLLGDLINRMGSLNSISPPSIPLDSVSNTLNSIPHHNPWQPPPLSSIPEETSLLTPSHNPNHESSSENEPDSDVGPDGRGKKGIAKTPTSAYFDLGEDEDDAEATRRDPSPPPSPPPPPPVSVHREDPANWGSQSPNPSHRKTPSLLFPENNGPLLSSALSSTHSLQDNSDPYSYSAHREDDTAPKILLIRHSDSFDDGERDGWQDDSEDEGGLGVGGRRGSASPSRRGSLLANGPTGVGDEGEWDVEGDPGEEGGDQAGVILGLHNIHIVIPQFFVTAVSSIVFALFSTSHSIINHPGTTVPTNGTVIPIPIAGDEITDLAKRVLRRAAEDAVSGEVVEEGWDALGMVFRIGAVAAAVSAYLSWRMTRDREKERVRRSRGTG